MAILLSLIMIFFLCLWAIDHKKLEKKLEDQSSTISRRDQERTILTLKVRNLEEKNTTLNKYEGIIDAELKSQTIIKEAENNSKIMLDETNKAIEKLTSESQEIKSEWLKKLEEAFSSAKSIKEQANIEATKLRENAATEMKVAVKEAELIIKGAEDKAKMIAGDAYKAMVDAGEFEKTAEAMKNIIEGYGDRYLIPTYSILDDLADEFGHTDAGENLKLAREKTRMMIKYRTSAKCDYVEAYRKETAINFILDAFNGKVDSILSKVKKDNYGTLNQKIKDAYQQVNYNGRAFRNAMITPEYLETRIEELKWAVITQELKWQEQEEQRQIKEQIREEEKARRDFEKAIREAQKEEEALKKLIEKAQKEVAFANEEQKSKYEAKLQELEYKLKVAEDKNLRALSMAQQTKSGNVYIISNIGSFGENIYKIGMTRRLEPLDRIRELGDASVPFEFDVHAMIFSENAPSLERELHKAFLRLQMNKVNPRKEFFKIELSEIKSEIDKMNIETKWTMVAEAKQFRESMTIELAISNDKQKRLEWEQQQLQIDPVQIDEEIEVV
jgi:hypothetical protein